MEKLLEDGHLKLSSVISDIHGISGRDMLDALAAGQRDPKALAQLARGSMRGKIARLEDALDCSFFTDQHAAVLAMMLAAIDYYATQIAALTATIEELIAPYLHQVEQIDAVHGIGRISAQDIIAEIGADMTVFPTAAHLLSWARWSPHPWGPVCQGRVVTWPGDLRPSGWGWVAVLLAFLAVAGSCAVARPGSSWSARSRAAARTNELDAGERRPIIGSEEEPLRLSG